MRPGLSASQGEDSCPATPPSPIIRITTLACVGEVLSHNPSEVISNREAPAEADPFPSSVACDTDRVFTVRATKKLLDRFGGPSRSEEPTTTALGDWYATVLRWRPQVALFVNEPTRLPVLVALAPAASVVARFVDQLAVVLTALRLDTRFVEREFAAMSEHRLAKTASRSVVGSMNDFAFLAAAQGPNGAGELVALSLQLAHTPCGPLRTGTGFPDLEVRALVDRITSRRVSEA